MATLTKKQRALLSVEELKKMYPEAKCSLFYSKPYELLIATRLSAQCTDARVNIVTKVLFEKYKTLEELANAELSDIEVIVKSCGLYKTKANDILGICNQLLDRYNGVVPDTIEELITLPGIGRKTANLIVGDVYKKPAVVVDTHCIRITNLIGLVSSKNPLLIEKELRKLLPPHDSNDFCHRLVLHGRAVCKARNPNCSICSLNSFCKHYNSKKNI